MSCLDDEARAELLCFLVVAQLFTYAREGEWLPIDHLVASATMWLASNGAESDWLDRVRLVHASRVIALQESYREFPNSDLDVPRLFNLKGGWFLDYRSPVVLRIHQKCVAHLAENEART